MPRLHVVTDDAVLESEGWLTRAECLLETGGPRIALHVRGPSSGGARLHAYVTRLSPIASATGAWLMVNDRVDIVMSTEATGVQLGERSLGVSEAKALLRPGKRIGVSRHTSADVGAAARDGADYAFVGTVFPTPSHPGLPGIGSGGLREAVVASGGLPVIGIGGIGPEEVPEVMATGARGVAVVRGVWEHPDPAVAVTEFLNAIEGAIDE